MGGDIDFFISVLRFKKVHDLLGFCHGLLDLARVHSDLRRGV